MDINKFKGVGTALVTPFTESLEVDYDALGRLIDFQVENGVNFLVVQGTTGESVTTSDAEKNDILRFIVEKNAGRLPVVYGVGGNNTRAIVAKLENLDTKGIDGILSVSPYYNKPTQEGIYEHYKEVAHATDLPIILYNVPGRTSSNISAETTLRLAETPNIVAVKEASGDLDQIMTIIRDRHDDFLVISGDDALTLPILACGGDGVISVVSNAFPNTFSFMVHQATSGNFEQARDSHYELLEITRNLFVEGNPAGVKEALKHLGICENYVRLPLVEVSKETSTRLHHLMEKNQFLAKV